MLADWFTKKKEQLPGTKRREEVVAREEEEEVVDEEGGEVVFEDHETVRAKSWQDLVAAAGGLLVMKDVVVQGPQGGNGLGDQPAGPGGQVRVQPAGPEGEAVNLPLVAEAAKKKTPLQYRLEQPKRMASSIF